MDVKKAQNATRQKRYREKQKATLEGAARNERKLWAALLSVTHSVIDGLSKREDKTPEIISALLELRKNGTFLDDPLHEALLRLDALHQTLRTVEQQPARYEDGTLKLL